MIKGYLRWKQGMAAVVASALIFTSLSATALAENDANSAREGASNSLEDTDGIENYGASLIDDGAGGKMIQTPNDGWNNQNKLHAEFKNAEALFKRTSFTVLADIKNTETATGDMDKRALISIGTDDNNLHVFTASGKLGYGSSVAGGGVSANNVTVSQMPQEDWSTAAIVYDEAGGNGGSVHLYLNGNQVAEVENVGFKMSEQSGIRGMLGRSFRTNFLMGGIFDNIIVKETALTAEEVGTEATARLNQKESIARWEGVSLPVAEVIGSIALPSANQRGDAIAWTSGNQEIIGDDGVVVKVPDEDTPVDMTATIQGESKNFQIVVKGSSVLLQEAYDALVIINPDDVRGDLPLVKEGKNGARIDWTSDAPKVITDTSDKEDSLYDGGIITRPAAGKEPVEVKLTAKITLGSASREKEFQVTVQPKEANLDTDYNAGYLWTFFEVSGGYEKIFLGYSKDGLTWEKLNKDENGTAQPILVNDAKGSDLGVRDPHLIRSAEGDKYWIIGTDLHAEGGGAGGSGWNQLDSSQNLVVWESTDLVNWSEPRLVYAGFDNAGCVWAPEAIYDETTRDYVIYWSARDKSLAGTDQNALRVYVCRTRDFQTFSQPKVWLSEDRDSGKEINIIDTTIVQDDGKYYRFSTSDWNTVMDVGDTLATDDVFDVRTSEDVSANGGWKRLVKRSQSGSAGFDGREGLTVYQLPDGKWCVMGDNQGYKAFTANDLSSAKFTGAQASFPDGSFRHGTVVRLSKAEEKQILNAYGEGQEPEPDPEAKVLAEFDFDKDGAGFESENAKATGKYALKDSYDKTAGKALYLDGSSDNYLTVTDKDGGSLLTGARELTISYDAKPDRTNTNWVMYAAPTSASPVYKNEKYLGILIENGSTTTAQRYNNPGSRPDSASAQTGSGWAHVDVVVSKTDTTMYVNGKKVSTVASSYALSSILGKSSILQIGKANWGSGEYYKGWIDNFRIENRALSEEEVKNLSAAFVDTLPSVASATVGTAPDRETALEYRGTDDHTSIKTDVDQKKRTITSYVRKNTDITNIPLTFNFNKDVDEIIIGGTAFTNGGSVNLSEDLEVVFAKDGKEEAWTVKKPVLCNNPVLPGQYADPDIDYFDGKFWIFPTTDGFPSWSGTVFHAFSSKDMVEWKDEGIIMELANDNPGVNENGVQIAASPWAVNGSAWAPTIEKKGDKYYFYYCGKLQNGQSAIGVAVADNPAGPYTDLGEPLLTVDMCRSAGVSMGQAIDPSIFTDEDGTSYIAFGNSNAAIAQLNDDMMSIKDGTLKQVEGLKDFRESVVVTKANGKYHWTWSCDDANNPNYHVNYGVSDTIDGKISVKGTLLQKDESKGILGSAHQSVVHVQDGEGKDRYFMAYHRFYTPLDIFNSGDGLGKHRETCIDEITFDEDGYMQITPTLEGVPAVKMEASDPGNGDDDHQGGSQTPDGDENQGGNAQTPDDGKNQGGNSQTPNGGKNPSDAARAGAAKTGDVAPLSLLILASLAALGTTAVAIRRKRKFHK